MWILGGKRRLFCLWLWGICSARAWACLISATGTLLKYSVSDLARKRRACASLRRAPPKAEQLARFINNPSPGCLKKKGNLAEIPGSR